MDDRNSIPYVGGNDPLSQSVYGPRNDNRRNGSGSAVSLVVSLLAIFILGMVFAWLMH